MATWLSKRTKRPINVSIFGINKDFENLLKSNYLIYVTFNCVFIFTVMLFKEMLEKKANVKSLLTAR